MEKNNHKPARKLLVGLLAASLIPLAAAIFLLQPSPTQGALLIAWDVLAVLIAWRLLESTLPASYNEWMRRGSNPIEFVERLLRPVEDFITNISNSTQPEKDDILRQRLHRRLDALAKRRNLLPEGGDAKDVTVLISDLRGFTFIADNYSAAEVVKSLNRYFTRMTQIISQYGGTVDKFIGDSIMAIFAKKENERDDAESAVCCAVEMQIAMNAINNENLSLGMPSIFMGVGINSGRVIAGKIGSDLHSEYTVIGKEVNLASRIEASSLRGQILISYSTYALTKNIVQVKEPFSVSVKGKRDSILLYEVKGIGSPYNLIVPEREARRTTRVQINLPFQFQIYEGKVMTSDLYNGVILDIGAGGMLAATKAKIKPHLNIKFRIKGWLGNNQEISGIQTSDIYGKILRVKRINGEYEVNIEFTIIDPQDTAAIKELVNSVLDKSAPVEK